MPNKMQKVTIEDLLALIVQGEGEKIEFKAGFTNVAETVCAMANAGGCNKGVFRKVKLMKNKLIYNL